ncbi:MAG: polyprenol phosphomannose-dependent alpha 1,6 mannosyltransferase MptB [Micropruina sp.]|uniref:polyprenol phosphomannose-dependent alpha 1,6 mannosyltransferase MptB n=1 Tax=Micropruina sp. TaxID=2737536 RepID=UPI0039E37EA7
MPAVPDLARRGPGPAAIGVLGTLLIGWGSCHPEFAHGPEGWPCDLVNAIGLALPMPWNRVAIVVGVLLLVAAWWLLKPTPDAGGRYRSRLLTGLALWSLPLLLAPPILSADAVLYADLGWIVSQGQNPYLVGLTGAGGPYAPHVDPLWAGSGVAYPPLALLIDAAMVGLTGFATYGGIVAMRLPALLALAVIAWVLSRLTRELGLDADRALWWAVANPLVVLHFVGGAHNDALMVAVALVGIWLAMRRPGWVWSLLIGPAAIGVAMAIKPQAGLAVLACAGLPVVVRLASEPLPRRLWLLGRRSAIAAVVAIVTFVLIGWASGLGFGWTRWLALMGKAGTVAPLSLIAQAGELLIGAAGGDPTGWLQAVGVASGLTTLVVVGWVLLRFADRPLAAVAWGSLAVSALGQSMHPWYVPWSVVLLALLPLTPKQFRWLTGFVVAFAVWNAIQTVVWHSVP